MSSLSIDADSDANDSPSSTKGVYKDPDDGRQRFLLELEFVQCLANPTYIHYLAQNRYFDDEAFIGYLKYLQYWQRPEYIKFIMLVLFIVLVVLKIFLIDGSFLAWVPYITLYDTRYPHCLYFLELLQNPNFRSSMAHPGSKELAHRQQFYFWKNYRNNRLKHILPRRLPEHALPQAAVAAPPALPPPPMSAPSPDLSPMQSTMPPGSGVGKNDMKSGGIDRRKRKKDG